MNRYSILTKTGKGLMEATGKTSNLSRDLRNVLKEIDGKVSVSALLDRLDRFTEPRLLEALGGLERDGYVREFLGPQDTGGYAPVGRAPTSEAPADAGEDLDFTSFTPKPAAKERTDAAAARAREEAAAKARAEAAARAKAEAEQRARAALAQQLRPETRPPSQTSAQVQALDQARREAEERQRREAEEKARREAEVRARIEAEDRVKREAEERQRADTQERIRREEEERARREVEARARREVEERARKEAEERRRREIEEQLRREEVERRLREEQERARREAEMRARIEAEERARREQEERARRAEEAARRELEQKILEEEERERREQEERARREEEEKAAAEEERRRQEEEEGEARTKQEARRAREEEKRAREEERARAREAEQARKAERSRERAGEEMFRGDEGALVQERARAARSARDWTKGRSGSPTKTIALMLLVILIVAGAALPFVPIESAPYERAAQGWLGVPVKIGTTSVGLVPSPHLKFEKVVIGGDPQMRVATVRAIPEIDSLFADRKAFRSLTLEGVVFPSKYVPVLLSNKGEGNSLRVAHIAAKGLKLDIPDLNLPPLDVNARLGADGAVQSVVLSNAERKLSVILMPQGKRAAIEISADAFPLPIGGDLALGDFVAKGTVTAGELALNEVEGRAFGGRLQGNARVRWTDGWVLDGELSARGVDAAKLAAPILAGGTLEGKGTYAMKASAPQRLFASARLEGTFSIQKGSITNVDMTRLLQGSSTGGGTTLFSEMSGAVSADPNRLHVRQLRLAAGLLNGTGQVEMDSQKNLSGRMQIELRAQTVQARATIGVAGTLNNPQFRRTN